MLINYLSNDHTKPTHVNNVINCETLKIFKQLRVNISIVYFCFKWVAGITKENQNKVFIEF